MVFPRAARGETLLPAYVAYPHPVAGVLRIEGILLHLYPWERGAGVYGTGARAGDQAVSRAPGGRGLGCAGQGAGGGQGNGRFVLEACAF